MIRTQELLAARRVDGAEQYFSRAYEFGFSKNSAEALRIWDKEKILSDVVWVIRKYQPDVIIKRFPPDARAGHGHHAASSILADEAFTAAADPNKFPEQFKYGVKPWQAKRILWNTYNFGGNNTTSDDQLKVNIGGYNPLIGKSYGELGGEARTMHKSQGEGRPRRRGDNYEYFVTIKGEAPKTDLMDGIVTDWKRIAGGEAVEAMINSIATNYKIDAPQLSVPALIELHEAMKALPASIWRDKKLDEVQQLIIECSGLYIEATSTQQQVVQGDFLKMNFSLIERTDVKASLKDIKVESFDSAFTVPLVTNQNVSINRTLAVTDDKKISQPYWLEYPLSGGTFDVRNQLLIGKAENDPSFEASIIVNIGGEDFTIKKPVQYKVTDAVKGDVYQPIAVLPKLELNYTKDNFISLNSIPVKATMHLKSNLSSAANYSIVQQYSKKWTNDIPSFTYDTKDNGNIVKAGTFTSKSNEKNTTEEIDLKTEDGKFGNYTKTISYDHIPTITYFPKAKANLINLDIKIIGKKIGYVNGAGDKVAEALKQMAYDVTILSEKDITDENLKQYDAIITGIRAYNLDEYLTNKYDVLMRYVQNGGNIIAQYIRGNQVNDKTVKAGPYPFTTNTSSRVTEEDAKVTFLLPENPALNYPNEITQKDFEGWVQERSTYQASQLDSHYETPLGMSDTGEPQGNGSLAIAKYGKGNFVYASLVFFRQLPVGVPGAYRLIANLIALPQNK